jgi:cysteine desulfurase
VTRTYFDYAASTPLRPEALEAMLPYLEERGYNASSLHTEGRAARAAIDAARERVAAVLHAKPKEIVFTAGGSEADNLAAIGVARALRERGRHVVSTAIEHHAMLHAFDDLRSGGFDVTLLGTGSEARVEPDVFAAALRDDTILASVMYVNNEIGTVQPIARLAAIARARGALFHTDAIQAATYLPLDVGMLQVDLLSLASHKFCGPKGAGLLFVRAGTPLQPVIRGGSQEYGRRAGTENVAAIAGMAAALELAAAEREAASSAVSALRERFEDRVLARIPDVRVNGAAAPRAPHIANLSIRGIASDQLLLRLDLEGMAVSAGSACASGAIEPSHVLAALGVPREWAAGVVRFSFGRGTTAGEIDQAVEVLERAVEDLRFSSRA